MILVSVGTRCRGVFNYSKSSNLEFLNQVNVVLNIWWIFVRVGKYLRNLEFLTKIELIRTRKFRLVEKPTCSEPGRRAETHSETIIDSVSALRKFQNRRGLNKNNLKFIFVIKNSRRPDGSKIPTLQFWGDEFSYFSRKNGPNDLTNGRISKSDLKN